ERTEVLSALVRALVAADRNELAERILPKLEKTARATHTWRGTHGQYAHGAALENLISAQLAMGRLDEAKGIASKRGEVDTRAQNLRQVALALATAGRVDEAHRLANLSTESYGYRKETLRELVERLATTGQFEAAQRIAEQNPYKKSQARSFQDLGVALA